MLRQLSRAHARTPPSLLLLLLIVVVVVDSSSDMEGVSNETPIPLPNVTGKILSKVVEYCRYHLEHPTPTSDDKKDEKRTDDIIPWDQEFCKVDQATLFELILVSAPPPLVIFPPSFGQHACSRRFHVEKERGFNCHSFCGVRSFSLAHSPLSAVSTYRQPIIWISNHC